MKFIFLFFPDPPKYSSNVEKILCSRTLVSHTPSLDTFPAWRTSNKICTTSDLQKALAYLKNKKIFFSLKKIIQRSMGINVLPPLNLKYYMIY